MSAAPGEQVLYRSERTEITRHATSPWGGPVVRAVRSGPDAHRRTLHEATILRLLAGIDGVPRLLSADGDGATVVADAGGTSLASLIRAPEDGLGAPWRFADLLDVAIRVTSVLGEIHRRNVIHRDVSPANLLLVPGEAGPGVQIIDFELALHQGAASPGGVASGEIEGSLAYLAPEQTGRTGRPVDARSDLYALGITLYELATGRPPFGRGEEGAISLIHDHLARRPVPLRTVAPDLPGPFSEVVARLLEKEPDRRYQSAEGLLHDLCLIRTQLLACDPDAPLTMAPMRLGTRDFPIRFRAPERQVAREHEAELAAGVFADALTGTARGLLLSGAAGVGKTALVEELRPRVAEVEGWFVATTFTRDGGGHSLEAGTEALRALGRLILAEPEDRLVDLRRGLLAAIGDKAGVLAGVAPEFGLVLDVEPASPAGDPVQAQAAAVAVASATLAALARTRPIVVVLDGLQWAPSFPLDLFDAVLTGDPVGGLLVIGAYRDEEVGPGHPVAELTARWYRLGVAPQRLHLTDLSPEGLTALVAEVLRLEQGEDRRLADVLFACNGGNPQNTLDLLNALRAGGALAPGPDGWSWSEAAIRHDASAAARAEVLGARLLALAAPARRALEVLSLIGGRAEPWLLAQATGVPLEDLQRDLQGPLAEGLVTAEAAGDLQAGDALVMRHDRVRQVLQDALADDERQALHLQVARRLAASERTADLAAEQYLAATGALEDEDETRAVVERFAAVATELQVTNPAAAERFLAEAGALLGRLPRPAPGTPQDAVALRVPVAHHAALYGLGRFEEADVLYAVLEPLLGEQVDLITAGAVQIASLTNRARPHEAVELGLRLLQQLGIDLPARDLMHEAALRDFAQFYPWLDEDDTDGDLHRAELPDGRLRAAAEIVSVMMAPSFFCAQDVLAWLVTQSRRMWAEHGPCRALVIPLCHAAIVGIGLSGDFLVGYRVIRRIRDAGVARRYEPEVSRARFLFSVSAGHWFDPLEDVLDEARTAREGLLNGGDSQGAVFTYHTSAPIHLDTAASLDEYQATIASGTALSDRTGNDQTAAALGPYHRLIAVLRASGPRLSPRRPDDDPVPGEPWPQDDAAPDPGTNPMASVNEHQLLALEAALLGDDRRLAGHAAAAMHLVRFVSGNYAMSRVHLLHALGRARVVRAAGGADDRALAELDASRAWLAARAADSPSAFAHLLSLVDAERAWAIGDPVAARTAFDRALQQVSLVTRPWHRAHLLERAGLFALAQREEYQAALLLDLARHAYARWGATAKVAGLQLEHPFLRESRPAVDAPRARTTSLGISSDELDMLAVLQASQALSRETTIEGLRDQVVDVLTEMTGATSVSVLLRGDDDTWMRAEAGADPAGGTDLAGSAPLSAVRFAARTGEEVVVADAGSDHRFATDPYVAAMGGGSLMVLPIVSRGVARVVLVLENRLQRGVFSADRLDALRLVAGQLAVSFDIALARRALQRESDHRLQLLGTLQSRERLLETLLGLQRQISHRAPLQSVLDGVTAGASGLLGGDHVALVLAEGAATSLPRVPSVSGRPVADADHGRILAVADESISADSMASLPAVGDRLDGAAVIAAPVHVNGGIIGSLVTRTGDGDVAAEDRADLLAAFAEQVSLALNDATSLEAIQAASLDSLTGLATRALFLDRLGEAMAREVPVCVLFLDLNRFKQVNDSLGHDAGDALLVGVADRIRSCIRDSDTAARFGGDEFAVLLDRTEGAEAGVRVGGAIIAALNRPIRVAGKDLLASGSIGVAAGGPGMSPAGLLKQADLAMYQAKRSRARRPVVFQDEMHEDVARRLDLEGDLQRALASGDLHVQYQPLVAIDDGRIVGVEALARWNHPERGPISPAEFIALAEDTGLIVDLGRVVLRDACRQVAVWRATVHPDLALSVNVSGRQLAQGHLAEDVAAILAETGLDAGALTLELTESVLVDDPVESQARLEHLKRIGVHVSLDDFGTGYSSLAYLHRFPVDELKIDRSFVDKIGESDADLAIVRVVVELARILGLSTVAEGVETVQQQRLLATLGCRLGQGYLFSKPLNPADLAVLLAKDRLPRQDDGRQDRASSGPRDEVSPVPSPRAERQSRRLR